MVSDESRNSSGLYKERRDQGALGELALAQCERGVIYASIKRMVRSPYGVNGLEIGPMRVSTRGCLLYVRTKKLALMLVLAL